MIRTLVATLTVLAVAVFGLASAQEYVEVLDDGRIQVTSVYPGDSIVFEPGELGEAIENAWLNDGPLPYEGESVSVVTLQSGQTGAISGGALAWAPGFSELTGADVTVVERPFNDLASVIFTDLRTGTGAYDGFMPPMAFMGEFVNGEFLMPINDWIGENEFPQWTDDTEPADDPTQWAQDVTLPSLNTVYRWDDTWYAVPWDSDGQVLYYRKDVIENPDVQAAYQEATGDELRVPRTVDELVQQSCYFDDTDPLGTGEDIQGVMLPGALGSQFFEQYKVLTAQYVVRPGGADEGFSETLHFDPETFEPLINSPAHVRALETMMQLFDCGPSDGPSIDLGASFNRFVAGEAVFSWNFGDTGNIVLAEGEDSPLHGNLGVTNMPGSTEVYNYADESWVAFDEPNTIGNLAGASWSGVVSHLSDAPEATYAFFAFLGTETMGDWNAKHGFNGIDLGRPQHFLPPDGTADIEMFLETGANESDIREVSNGYYENFSSETYEYLKIPGTAEYNLALEQQLQAAITDQVTAQEALDRVAQQWSDISERLGFEQQHEYYREITR
jgi:multiple sugar transport system substrate-binding protein